MYPTILKLGPISLHSYGLMIAIGFLLALHFSQRGALKAGIDPKIYADAALWVLPIGIAGTRVLHIIMYPENYSWGDPIGWINVSRGGLVFQGGPPPVILFLVFYLKKRGVSFWQTADIVAPYLAMGHGIGRIGCFLYGCCYGKPTDVPWGIPARRVPWDVNVPPEGSPAFLDHLSRFSDVTYQSAWSHPIHPTQLYSFVGLMTLGFILLYVRAKWNPWRGFVFPVYLILYGLFRFVVEFFRGDHNPTHVLGLSDQQIFALLMSLIGVALFIVLPRMIPSLREAATQPDKS